MGYINTGHYFNITIVLITALFLIISSPIYAQENNTKTDTLPTILINASKIVASKKQIPLTISTVDLAIRSDISQQLSLNDYVNTIPGLFALNANNFSQDLRVSIRGFGARSAFGIRGIKIIVDGIPETTPDGQGQIDNLNIGAIDKIEIIRGPASSLYGNASGGVINILTKDQFETNFVKAGLTFGSYGFQQYQVNAGFLLGKTNVLMQETNTTSNGYRVMSGFKSNNLNLKIRHAFSNNSKLNVQINYSNSPFAGDSGGLTLEEVEENRKQARERNLDFKTEESINQFKIGTNFNHKWTKSIFNAYGFFSSREFLGKLPFENGGIVDLDRKYYGFGSSYNHKSDINKFQNTFQVGFDLANQNDTRKRFDNLQGVTGAKSLDQLESYATFGVYALNHVKFEKVLLNFGMRFDYNRIEASDNFLANGDQSGTIYLNSFNPSIGLSYQIQRDQYLYGNFSTSFETPVMSELSANVIDEGGFNKSLNPQKARNFEIGYKVESKNLSGELALFYITTTDDIISYELEMFPGRTFYKNAGETIRKGLEMNGAISIDPSFNITLNYTYSDFKFDTYSTSNDDFNDNELPGIPKHMGAITFLYHNKNGLKARFVNQFVGALFLNDANSVKDQGYLKTDINIGYEKKFKNLHLIPFVGINNLFNTAYNDNIRINAFGGRYYEPAPGINVFGGIRLLQIL